jgi:hypothetical protein
MGNWILGKKMVQKELKERMVNMLRYETLLNKNLNKNTLESKSYSVSR